MATKAEVARKSLLVFSLNGSTRTVLFDCVRHWSIRAERKIIPATNNDSSGWRELVMPSTDDVGVSSHSNSGQLQFSLSAEAIYDMSTAGFGGVTDRAQRHDRQQLMRHLITGTAMANLTMEVGSTVHAQPSGSWASLGPSGTTIRGFCESAEVGGTYDQPVILDMMFRGNGAFTF